MLEKLREKYGDNFSWYELTVGNIQKRALEERLILELVPAHDLFENGKNLVAVAKSERNDDVLFWDGKDYYVIHLTWRTGNAYFPSYKIVKQYELTAYLENDYLYG